MLESDKQYLAYILSKREAKLEQLYSKVNILNNFSISIESFFHEKEDLVRSLKDKNLVSEKELTHSSYMVCKMMNGSQKYKEIINSAKYFSDKR